MRFRLRLYYSVFLPMLSYSASVWCPEIANKITYTQSLTRLQRKILVSLTGVYKTTSHRVLQKLLNIADVNVELETIVKQQSSQLDKRELKIFERTNHLNRLPDYGFEAFRHQIESSRHRYFLRCLSNTGPFLDYLHTIFPHLYTDTAAIAPRVSRPRLTSCSSAPSLGHTPYNTVRLKLNVFQL